MTRPTTGDSGAWAPAAAPLDAVPPGVPSRKPSMPSDVIERPDPHPRMPSLPGGRRSALAAPRYGGRRGEPSGAGAGHRAAGHRQVDARPADRTPARRPRARVGLDDGRAHTVRRHPGGDLGHGPARPPRRRLVAAVADRPSPARPRPVGGPPRGGPRPRDGGHAPTRPGLPGRGADP